MKTTLELPDELVQRLKLRAVRDGRTVEQIAADLLADALPNEGGGVNSTGLLVPKSLPLIKIRPAQSAVGKPLTGQEFCDFIKDIELQHEIERHENTFGHQYVDRTNR